MSLIIAAVVPHNPILLEKKDLKNPETQTILPHTKVMLDELKKHIREQRIDTIVILSTQTPRLPVAFGVNYALKATGTFEQFGDLGTSVTTRCDIALAQHIKEYSEGKIAMQTFSAEKIDYGISVPVLFLQNDSHPFKIVSLSVGSTTSKEELYTAGSVLVKKIDQSTSRIALLLSMHGSHTKPADTAFATTPLASDQQVLTTLQTTDYTSLQSSETNVFTSENLIGLDELVVFLGMLQTKKYAFDNVVYERQFGIGHITTFTQL